MREATIKLSVPEPGCFPTAAPKISEEKIKETKEQFVSLQGEYDQAVGKREPQLFKALLVKLATPLDSPNTNQEIACYAVTRAGSVLNILGNLSAMEL
ncbi:MAG: hypothetical protein WC003_13365 [Terrimicrobiaceae bacterium]